MRLITTGAIILLSCVHFGACSQEAEEKWTVSWNAPFLSGNGYGSEALATVVGLNATLPSSWSISINQHGDSVSNEFAMSLPADLIKFLSTASKRQYGLTQGDKLGTGDRSLVGMQESKGLAPERTVVVCHSEPGAWSVPYALYETEECPPVLADKFNRKWGYIIGRTMFETDRLPEGWVDRLNNMDEVWVPTMHHKQIFDEAKVENVRVVGQGIDSNRWDPAKAKPLDWRIIDPDGQCNKDDVKFLSVFKWEKRKGHDLLIPAFWEAFPPPRECSAEEMRNGECKAPWAEGGGGEDGDNKRGACLVIVTSLYHTDPEEVIGDIERYWAKSTGRNEREYEDMEGVILLNGLSEEELIGLYKCVDAFVLPSRGEGWGRPYMEAMAMGLPVIATNWSGPTAFVTEDNGYLLENRLVDANLDAFPGHKWAEPDKEALKDLLVRIRDNLEEGQRKGRKARQDILEKWSHEKVALDIGKELERIARFGGKMPTVEDEEKVDNGQVPKTEPVDKTEEKMEAAKEELDLKKELVQERDEKESSSVAAAEEDADADRGQDGQNSRHDHDEL
mmetsp:Transcript_18086/g.51778  ORF Transcript_18086/g.51778 Transcript_18086/m.51778 type:complete len:563 (+) Transcript_18086:66-1754(+)